MKQIVLVMCLAFVLVGCNDGNYEEEKKETIKITSVRSWGSDYIKFKTNNEEVTIKLDKLKRLVNISIPNDAKYCGEYYHQATQWYYDRDKQVHKQFTNWVWSNYENSKQTDSVDGYVKIDGEWIPKKNVIHYADVPDKYQPLRDKIEKQVKKKTK